MRVIGLMEGMMGLGLRHGQGGAGTGASIGKG